MRQEVRMVSMTSVVIKGHEDGPKKRGVEYRSASRSWDRCSIGAVVGLAGGLGVGLSGVALTAVSFFAGADSYVRTLGTVLLSAMIPPLVFGAHCLDLTEKRKDAERRSRFGEEN
jgi:hypothetical protein